MSKKLQRFIAILQSHLNRIKTFQEHSYQMLLSGKSCAEIFSMAQDDSAAEEIRKENRLYMLQTIKHLARLAQHRIPPTLDLIKTALNPEFCADLDILEKQTNVVVSTYYLNYQDKQEYAKVKSFCFKFIGETFRIAGYTNPNLLDYLFLEDTISDENFEMLCESFPIIQKNGMHGLIAARIQKMADNINKPAIQLNNSEHNILKVLSMFAPQTKQYDYELQEIPA